jgi:hypothetical protein
MNLRTLYLVALLASFALAGCTAETSPPTTSGNSAAADGLDFKVGIMTGTVSQGEDEYRGAERVIEKYGKERILHRTYPDNFTTEQETTITQLMEMADDPEVKAIIVAQAIPGTLPAIQKIRRKRSDILFLLVSPQEDPEQIAANADLAMQTDDLLRGEKIIENAKKMGAKTFIHYTFPRHMSMEILATRRDIMRDACFANGIEFVSVNAPDPTGDQGIAGSQRFILEDVPRQIARYGADTCFFSTNCAMQEPLIRSALDGGGIFTEQCCPSPTHGYPGALGISIDEASAGDMAAIRGKISEKVAEKGLTGRFGSWEVSIHIVMIEALVELAKDKVHGKIDITDPAAIEAALEKAGSTQVELGTFKGHKNFVMVIAENVPL